jgi:arabinogalactan oligomer/maltooligosaccharide transport system substrate-binding protein
MPINKYFFKKEGNLMFGKVKKIFVLGLSVVMITTILGGWSLAASSKPTVNLTLWGSQNDQAMLQKMVNSFKAAHPNKTYNIKLGVQGEDTAMTAVLKDIDVAGDVFAFASDQIAGLQSAGALMPVTIDAKQIKAANTAASVNASSVNGQLYAYPSSSDTYFLYYDKKYLKDADVKSLETMMSKNVGAGVTNFAMNLSNGWYIASFFYSAGCQLFGANGTDPTKCDFNSAKGVTAAQYIIDLVGKGAKFKDYGQNYDSSICQNFKDRKLAAAVSGTWNAESIKKSLGKDFGATKLPTINLDGKTVNMGSFANFKLLGVNSHTKNAADAMALAEWLTNKDNQLIRFQTRSYAFTNLELSKHTALLGFNVAVGANTKQGQYATLQPSIKQTNNYWTPAAALGTSIEAGKTTTATLKSDLDKLVSQILSKIQ